MNRSRRRFLIGAGSAVVAAGVAACGRSATSRTNTSRTSTGQHHTEPPTKQTKPTPLPPQRAGLPERQFAWDATLRTDAHGNGVVPRHDRLLFFDVRGTPTAEHVRTLEAALRDLEHEHEWSPSGILFVVGWGHPYFTDVLHTESPIPKAKALSDFELPSIDEYHLCIHLASDHQQPLLTAERTLRRKLAPVLRWRETRTGFVGAGLPAAHQRVGGIPKGKPVPKTAPLYMGFKSNFKRNQATEDAIAIPDGPFAQGTTLQVSYMRLRLDSWYGNLSYAERVARMYSPETTPAEVARLTTDAKSNPGELEQAIKKYGVIGHSQTSARARVQGKPLILRRDFNTADGGQAGLHFVSLQRNIEDFVKTRTAMNASGAQLQNPAITDTVNNGINEFIFVLKRANYIVPRRVDRAFPLLPARSGVL